MRYLVVRLGAYGDNLIVSPLLSHLKKVGHEVYVLTSEQGQEIFKHNPNIDKLIQHKRDSIPNSELGKYFESVKQAYECDKLLDLCESIEMKLALHPLDPKYNWTKQERKVLCNKNYYDFTFEQAGFPGIKGARPEIYFSEEEEHNYIPFREQLIGYYVIIWGLSGSGLNKSYPYAPYVINSILSKYPKVKFITVGDEACEILECGMPNHSRIVKKSGKWSFRESALAVKHADLVIAPDTGLLHIAGCFSAAKIGLLNHSTIENITKYFENDNSIEADCDCAPCFRLIYNSVVQCPKGPVTKACLCMSDGIKPKKLLERIEWIINVQQLSFVS